jgi:pSer/pThr/pTyr-binding forkhead associated (FHA) protein
MPEIIVKLGERIIHRYFFDKDSLTIGRARDNDIVIENLSVSRNHARLKKEDSKFVLTDLSSANGTLVNGVRVTSAEVVHNDQLTIGKHTLVFLHPEAASGAPASGAPSSAASHPVPTSTQKFAGLIGVLTVTKGKQAGQEFRVSKAETTIGRAPESDVRLHDWFVSKKHASITRKDDVYTLRDLDSWRGTTVNGTTIREHVLKESDELVFGTTVLSFRPVDAELLAKMTPPPVPSEFESDSEEWGHEMTAGKPGGKTGPRIASVTPLPGDSSPIALTPALPTPKTDPPAPSPVAAPEQPPLESLEEGDSIKLSGVLQPAEPRPEHVTSVNETGADLDDEFAPMTDEELEALESEADDHEGTTEEERENRKAAWELAHAEKVFELDESPEGYSFMESHEDLQKGEDAFAADKDARNGLVQRTAKDRRSDSDIAVEAVAEEKALFAGPMPDQESDLREVALASSTDVSQHTPSRGAVSAKPTGEGVPKEIAMWEKALQNKSVVIRKNAAKELKKLTGKDYDWQSEPGGS